MSRIVTFYSYKGGVGRTFALANIGVVLAQQGKRVLLIDMDLEAPGLDRYFHEHSSFPLPRNKGTIHLLHETAKSSGADWRAHLIKISAPKVDCLDLLPSGSAASYYAKRVQEFSWSRLFSEQHGGEILERWRVEWKQEYDFVLLDSRTGITDTGGVCTILLPDFLVIVFTANRGSLEGAIMIAEEAQRARRQLAVPRHPLTILPLPSRFDGRDEIDAASFWLELFSSELKPFYDDWLPKRFSPRQILELTKIPYVTKFSFGEPLPVLVQSVTDPDSPGFFLANAARLLSSDFRDAGKIIDPNAPESLSGADKLRIALSKSPIDEAKLHSLLRQVEDEEGSGPEFARLLGEVGDAFHRQARFSDAEPFFRRSLAIKTQSLGPDHPEIAESLNNLAALLSDTNRLGEAEPLYRRALLIDEKNFGPEHPNVAIRLNNLAELFRTTDRLAEAEALYRRALVIDEQKLGSDHPNVAVRLNNLAELLRLTNRFTEAEPLYRRALAIFEKTFGLDHHDVATSLNNLALLFRTTDRPTEAEALYRRALAIFEKTFGPDHPNVATSLSNLGLLLRRTNRVAEAEPLYRRALLIDEKSFGPDHPNVARDLNNLAKLLHETNRTAEAESLYRRALLIGEKGFSPNHPNVAKLLENYASLLRSLGRLEEAAPLESRAKSIRTKQDGGSPDV
jgi:tetratricopeptide (TPR) repeat protein/MinD-like ATPase involved in chromosome partitioning or flagellar assembly